MKIEINALKNNPYRDFDLYPLDLEQVARLKQSIGELGFFAGVTARPSPSGDGTYELAAGHHRVAAAKVGGLTEVEVNVDNYNEEAMVRIMALENLTQRGHSTVAVTDSVAAFARLVTKQILLGEGLSTKFLVLNDEGTRGGKSLARVQQEIAEVGPGVETLYRAMNGFDKKERKANKQAENITSTEIDQTLASLKDGGVMATLVGEVYAEVEAIRLARRTAEEAAEAAERDAEQKEAVEAQKKLARLYDMRCAKVFRLTSHNDTFRKAVTTGDGPRFILRKNQLELAKEVRRQIDVIETKSGRDLGAVTIRQMVMEHIDKAVSVQKEIDAAEQEALLRHRAVDRVNEKWKRFRTTVARATSILSEIADEQTDWNYAKDLFPYDADVLDALSDINRLLTKLEKAVKGRQQQRQQERRKLINDKSVQN